MEIGKYASSIHAYQAANLSDQEIIHHFIVRKSIFERVMSEIERDDMTGSIQHYLLIGRRGSGKSTMLRRIDAEINQSESLSENLIVVYPSEEQAGIYRLLDLWDLIIQTFKSRDIPVQEPVWSDSIDLEEYVWDMYASIQQALHKANKKLVLLLDNIDRIFDNIRDDASLLRELLINHKDMRIIGGSTRMIEHYWKHDQPFYQFFQVIRLKSLSPEEVKDLLLHWSECNKWPQVADFVRNNPGKIETIRVLTDGMPRTLLRFIEILIDRPNQKGFEYLRAILDRASALYQERLNSLPPQQRKVVLELSNFWDAVKVKPLVQACKMPGKVISAQLNQLVKSEIVQKISTGKKDNLYRLSERFFNLWLLMTQGGPKQKQQVKYLTIFLENWYDQKELANIYKEHFEGLGQNTLKPDYAVMMGTALAHSKYITTQQRDALIEKTKSLKESIKDYLDYIPPSSVEIYQEALDNFNQGKFEKARTCLNNLEQEDHVKYNFIGVSYLEEKKFDLAEQYYLKAIDKGHVDALNNLAILYKKTNRPEEAEQYYLKAIDKGHVDALNNLAILYKETNRLEEAEQFYLKAIDKGGVDALFNLAILYKKTNRPEEAEQYYLKVIDKGHVDALNNLAILYKETNRLEEAEQYYLKAIDKGLVVALNNLANLYRETNRPEEAEQYYLQAIDKGGVDALFNLAYLYRETNRSEEAEHYYLKAIEKGQIRALNNLANLYQETNRPLEAEKYYIEAINQGLVDALFNLAILCQETNRPEEAEQYYLKAIDKGHVDALYNLANLYRETNRLEEAEQFYLKAIDKGGVDALFNLAILYGKTNRPEEAEQYYLKAIDKGDVNALNNLAKHYYGMNIHKKEAVMFLEKYLSSSDSSIHNAFYIILLLWAGEVKQFDELIKKELPERVDSEDEEFLSFLFLGMLVHKQYNLAWEWFSDKQNGDKLKDLIKPVYFVAAKFLGNQEAKEELLKPGPELEESFQQIHDWVLKRQKIYFP